MERTTTHHKTDGNVRTRIIKEMLGGYGNPILTNFYDRGHKDGAEKFILTDNAIIIVRNLRTDRHITDLIARKGQIFSRFGDKFKTLPREVQRKILDLCDERERKGYNII
jgi:hypothetical protein